MTIRSISFALGAVALACAGCGDRDPALHHADRLHLSDKQRQSVFISGHIGPRSPVTVLAHVPEARYERGAIVLTGGREMVIVQPHAWQVHTGTALTVDEAQQVIDEAARLHQAVDDTTKALNEFHDFLVSNRGSIKAGQSPSSGRSSDGPSSSESAILAITREQGRRIAVLDLQLHERQAALKADLLAQEKVLEEQKNQRRRQVARQERSEEAYAAIDAEFDQKLQAVRQAHQKALEAMLADHSQALEELRHEGVMRLRALNSSSAQQSEEAAQ